jgi:dsDNA-specific endonuclease/ATPase MutS2
LNPKTLATLEFDKILARLADLCQTTAGRELAPYPLTLSLSKGERSLRFLQ